jgi:hypothetical protein
MEIPHSFAHCCPKCPPETAEIVLDTGCPCECHKDPRNEKIAEAILDAGDPRKIPPPA